MFEEGKDLDASEQEFLEIFRRHVDSRLNAKLVSLFVQAFKRNYDPIKKMVFSELMALGYTRLQREVELFGYYVGNVTRKGHIRTSIDDEAEARRLGSLLGTFLGLMEYYTYRSIVTHRGDTHFLLALSNKIVILLKELDKDINLKFIRNRILAIEQKHAGKLSKLIQELYVEIAAQFA